MKSKNLLKKALIVLLCLSVLALAACGNQAAAPEKPAEEPKGNDAPAANAVFPAPVSPPRTKSSPALKTCMSAPHSIGMFPFWPSSRKACISGTGYNLLCRSLPAHCQRAWKAPSGTVPSAAGHGTESLSFYDGSRCTDRYCPGSYARRAAGHSGAYRQNERIRR